MADPGVKINSLFIPGYVTDVRPGPARLLKAKQHRWGTKGVTSIRSLAGDSDLELDITIFKGSGGTGGFASFAELNALLKTLRKRTGEAGSLTIITPAYTDPYEDCEFDGFHRGQRGAIPDIGGALGGGNNAWYIDGVLRFTLLVP